MTAIRLLLLDIMFLAVLSGCGPGDGREARGTGPEDGREAQGTVQGVGSLEEVFPFASGPVPIASENGTGSASGRGTVAGGKGDSPQDRPVVPDWMANDLASPDTQVRLKAVDRWAQQAPTGSVDPLIHALDDQDEQVQARALEWLVQDWVREQATKPPP